MWSICIKRVTCDDESVLWSNPWLVTLKYITSSVPPNPSTITQFRYNNLPHINQCDHCLYFNRMEYMKPDTNTKRVSQPWEQVMTYSTEFQSVTNNIWSDYISLPCLTYYSAMPNWLQEVSSHRPQFLTDQRESRRGTYYKPALLIQTYAYTAIEKFTQKERKSLWPFNIYLRLYFIVVPCEQLFPILQLLYKQDFPLTYLVRSRRPSMLHDPNGVSFGTLR
jgi:hypothetical protein